MSDPTSPDPAARAAPPDLAGFRKLLDAVENAAYRFQALDSNANREKLDARRDALLSAFSSLARERDEAREGHRTSIAVWVEQCKRLDAALAESAKLREERDAERAEVRRMTLQARDSVPEAVAGDAIRAASRLRERVEALATEIEGADFPWPRETLVAAIRGLTEKDWSDPCPPGSPCPSCAALRAETKENDRE